MTKEGHQGQEVEFKFRLSDKVAFDNLLSACHGKQLGMVTQENHFYDTNDRSLDKNKYVLSLRQEDAKFFITANGPTLKQKIGDLAIRSEEEIEIDANQAQTILTGQTTPLALLQASAADATRLALLAAISAVIDKRPLQRIGSFKNERTRVETLLKHDEIEFMATLELDKTTFPGDIVHYELEMELTATVPAETGHKALLALFDQAGIVGLASASKAKRFFMALDGKEI